jgi:hypothetical protein
MLQACFRVLSGFTGGFSRISQLVWNKLRRAASKSARGLFPPLGIASILALAAVTVGVPNLGASIRSLPYYIFLSIGIFFGVLLWKIPRERYNIIFASIFGWLPAFLGALSYIFWYWYATGSSIGETFFHAAADVLPVLLLATVIDIRRTNDLEGKQLVLPIAAVFLGELTALNALAFPDNVVPADFAAVASSLVTATIALVLAVMADVTSSAGHEHKEIERLRPADVAEANASVTAQTEASRDILDEDPES